MPFISVTGRTLEYEWRGESAPGKPTLVFLHEGLGSIEQWRDFPLRVASATGCAALVYSRYGYGQSDVLQEPRPPSFMHDEALRSLPELLSSLNIPAPVLLGHSDGASIALIHAGAGHAVRGPCERLTLPAAGHAPHRDQPAATLAAVARFVNGLVGG